MNNRLYVGNLSFDTTENDLQDAFAACGTVTDVNVVMDRSTNRSRGFGFVTMATEADAQTAIEQLNGKNVQGRDLSVNIARPREDRGESAGGGRSRGGYGGGGGGGGRSRQYSR